MSRMVKLSEEATKAGYVLHPSVSSSRVFHPQFGNIDFATLTAQRADYLVQSGYEGLVSPNPKGELIATKGELPITNNK